MKFQNLRRLRGDHLEIQHGIILYPYQEKVSDKILSALIRNLNVKTEADVENLTLEEIPIEFSRQSGKTTAIVHTIEIIMTFITEIYGRPISIGLFAPQIEQARTDFERLKAALRPIKGIMIQDDEQKQKVKERENAKTLVLPNGSLCWIAPITTTSKPESKTFDLMIFEEAQDIDDKIMKEQIWPIGSTTNAPRIYVGTAGTKKCYFLNLGRKNNALKLYFDEITAQRRELYKITKDPKHLIYEKTVKQEIEKHGRESDEIQRPYFGKWLIGTGQFATEEDMEKLIEDRDLTHSDTTYECFAGIDTAKSPDSTVVTILRYNTQLKKKQIINWLELKGENYQDQFDYIQAFLKRYKIMAIAIDSTGQGDFMPDLFQRNSNWRDENSGLYRIKFSAVSKDLIYKNLKVSIKELLTTLPKRGNKKTERFYEEMLDLQQEYKGQLLSVHHPDVPNAHDDYPDSWALAEWAYAKYNETTTDIHISTISDDKEREVVRDASGNIRDYWPDEE